MTKSLFKITLLKAVPKKGRKRRKMPDFDLGI